MKGKKSPTVMSINEHRAVTSSLSSQLELLESELKGKEDVILEYIKENTRLKSEVNELESNHKLSRDYWEHNTKTLHDQIAQLKEIMTALKLSNKAFELENRDLGIENNRLRERKWYQLLFK
jgi:regulator of replication initiation timing